MRWIFLILLLINLLLLVSIYQSDDDSKAASGKPPIGDIRLIKPEPQPGTESDGHKKITAIELPLSETAEQQAVCTSFGPLPSLKKAQVLQEELSELTVTSSIRQALTKSVRDFWVMQSRETTRNLNRDISILRNAGISDVSPIQDGENRGGISLGIFRSRDNAMSRLAEVDRLGLTPVVVERGSEATVFWVDMAEQAEEIIPQDDIDELISKFVPVSMNTQACNEIN